MKLLPGGQIDNTEVEGSFEVIILNTSFFLSFYLYKSHKNAQGLEQSRDTSLSLASQGPFSIAGV